MILRLITTSSLVLFLSHTTYSAEVELSSFKACQKPALTLSAKGIPLESTPTDCFASGALPTWNQMDDFIEKYNRHQQAKILPDSGIVLLRKVSDRVKFLTKLNIKELELQKKCFSEPSFAGCSQMTAAIRDGIKNNWQDMSLGAVLGFQSNSAVRYQFGAKEPDLFIFGTTKHPFGGKLNLAKDTKDKAQLIFTETKKNFSPSADSGMREHLQETYKAKYVQSLLNAPIMALVAGPQPTNKEIIAALDEMIENNQDMLKRELDPAELAGFTPVIESILAEQPGHCRFADHWIKTAQKREKTKNYLKLGAAGVTGVGCAVTAWTGVGMSLCFVSGALLTGASLTDSLQNKNLERMRTFTSALDSRLIQDFDRLSQAEQDYALELVMAPLAGLGVGSVIKSIAPTSKVVAWVDRVKLKSKPPIPVAKKHPVVGSLEHDMKTVKDRYKTMRDVDVQVCGMNIGESMCNNNIQEFLRFAKRKYPNIDLSKARVLKIQSEEYVPLYANHASVPSGYYSTAKDVKTYTSKVRSAKDGGTTWSKHFVLEYEGRIFDFDFADDTALTTAEYFNKMFADSLSGVVKDPARSTYLVRSINAEEFMNASDVRIYEIEGLAHQHEYFFDFYKSLPGADQTIKAPPIHPSRAQFVTKN